MQKLPAIDLPATDLPAIDLQNFSSHKMRYRVILNFIYILHAHHQMIPKSGNFSIFDTAYNRPEPTTATVMQPW